MIATSMTEPIISPWLIYAIDILNSISGAANIVCWLSLAVFSVILFRNLIGLDLTDEFIQDYARVYKRVAVVFLASFLVATIVPNKQTSYEMLAAAYVTPANVERAADMLDRFADKILKENNRREWSR